MYYIVCMQYVCGNTYSIILLCCQKFTNYEAKGILVATEHNNRTFLESIKYTDISIKEYDRHLNLLLHDHVIMHCYKHSYLVHLQ